ncbi:MAG TPA: Six-hairpin glycosidase-like protein [Rhodanobacteraceae bacterium]|nr:Six-hairpin glycosidase-like protein [Rhodanobacteraceae bacterium]
MIPAALLMLATTAAQAAPAWHTSLEWRGQSASMSFHADGSYALTGPFGKRTIPAPRAKAQTASVLFDGLFAMAQEELGEDSVSVLHDPAYDHGGAMDCRCFVTGVKWPYVWTRDVSYSIDLGLWRYEPARARESLLFKLSAVRAEDVLQGPASKQLYPMQDTGSGGSWPISTDRVVWFMGARHLLDDKAFADKTWRALNDTLAQDREYAFDSRLGLYRGETSFLDWREQTYPEWTRDNVVFIAQSFALSTNVLHYEALRLAARMAAERHDPRGTKYATQADALKQAINTHFWRDDRGMYMSYLGGDGMPVEAYDLLGLSLAITSGVADEARARSSLSHYPVWPAGGAVIWPERADQPIYHNRAIWPFVSAYALRAARRVDDPALIALEIRSMIRGPALAGSNMENYAMLGQATHVDEGKLSGPVVNSPRQLWSVAGYLDMAAEGVFGLTADGEVKPKLPVSLVPTLFGDRSEISLQLPHRQITLRRPTRLEGNLLVAYSVKQDGDRTVVTLKAITVTALPLHTGAPMYAPATPAAPHAKREGDVWSVLAAEDGHYALYVDGKRHGPVAAAWTLPASTARQCLRVTRVGEHGIESLPSEAICVGSEDRVTGSWPRSWTAPRNGRYRVWLDYTNDHGPINTGITAAVKRLAIDCAGSPAQTVPIVMPHSIAEQRSTTATFEARAGARCTFSLEQGFNMSDLAHFVHYTGGEGGAGGPLNEANVDALHIAPLPVQ